MFQRVGQPKQQKKRLTAQLTTTTQLPHCHNHLLIVADRAAALYCLNQRDSNIQFAVKEGEEKKENKNYYCSSGTRKHSVRKKKKKKLGTALICPSSEEVKSDCKRVVIFSAGITLSCYFI